MQCNPEEDKNVVQTFPKEICLINKIHMYVGPDCQAYSIALFNVTNILTNWLINFIDFSIFKMK